MPIPLIDAFYGAPNARCIEHALGGAFMQAYEDLVEIARICLKEARAAENPAVSGEFKRLAKGYQMRAATMVAGKIPDIGENDGSNSNA
jgi:hypothetical protein